MPEICKGKIQFNPPNYHPFSRWPPKLPRLVFWLPKLPKPLKKTHLKKYIYNTPATCHFSIKKIKKIIDNI
jgi:hypothetical protein